MFVLWCNGSTTVFGSVCLSSNLGRTTSLQSIIDKNPQNMQFCGFFVSLDKLLRKKNIMKVTFSFLIVVCLEHNRYLCCVQLINSSFTL